MELTGNVAGIIKLLGGGEGSTVVIEPVLTSGTKIADVSVDGVEKDLYAPTPTPPTPATEVTVTPVVTEGTKIATIGVDGVNTDLYAPEGGNGVVYSLTEHLVGKWLDGRDIYEKTYNVGSISIGPDGTAITSAVDNHNEINTILSASAISISEKSSINLMSFISSYTNDIFTYAYRTDNWEYITLRYIKNT